MKKNKKHWAMGLAAASMAVLLAGCGNMDMDGTTSGNDMSSGGNASIGDNMPEPTTGATGGDLTPGTDGSARSILPDGNNMPGFNS